MMDGVGGHEVVIESSLHNQIIPLEPGGRVYAPREALTTRGPAFIK
jgi:hypothetical protein